MAALVVGIVGLLLVASVFWFRASGPRASRQLNARFAAQIPALRAAYLNAEGDANRGPKFEQLAMALNHKEMSGAPPTEAEMVQTLGPPDLMLRGPAGEASFAYFYDRFGKKDWVVYFWYSASGLTIGWNSASANPQTHVQMVPYAPPAAATRPTTDAQGTGPIDERHR